MINSLFGNVDNIVHFRCNTQVFEKPLKLNKEKTLLQNVLLERTSEWRKEHRKHTYPINTSWVGSPIADIGGGDIDKCG